MNLRFLFNINLADNKNPSILKSLNKLLKPYYPELTGRKELINQIIKEYKNQEHLKISLDSKNSLILTKDVRKTNLSGKYLESPFPFLTTLESFSTTLGDWNSELADYGIKSRFKLNDPEALTQSVGIKIHLIKTSRETSKCNLYLRRQYSRLESLRKQGGILAYWELC